MKRLIMMLVLVALAIPATAFAGINSSGDAKCTPTGFYRDQINLTAAQIGGDVTGNLDAAGCDIGVYYGPGTKGSVKKATIENAKYFGVVNYRGKVNVKDSTISQIGNTPFDGTQHGVGILYTTEEIPYTKPSGTAEGTISGNVLHSYQKNGIVVRGAGASAKIEHNTLTGAGPVAYIAQNGIQFSFGGSGTVTGNTVSGHSYTPVGDEACGMLFYQAGKVTATAKGNPTAKETAKEIAKANNSFNNEVNICTVP
jgi:Right handed beta helix region